MVSGMPSPRLKAWMFTLALSLAGANFCRAQTPSPPNPAPSEPVARGPAAPAEPINRDTLPPGTFDEEFERAAVLDPARVLSGQPRVVMGPLDVMCESLFGPASKDEWKPLRFGTLFSEGWDEPYHEAPEGTNGAPKQNWIGAPAGVFGRFATLDFFYTNHMNNVPGVFLTANAPFMPVHTFTTGNQYAGYTSLFLPLSARFELVLGTVFIDSRKASPGGPYVGNWGDTGVQGRIHLIDQKDFSMLVLLGERIPTGKNVNGADINYITPGFEYWWNFAPKWVVRGQTSINILTGRKSGTSVVVNQLSAGRYLTSKDAAVFKDLEVHLTATVLDDVAGGAGFVDDVYLFPGFRFSLDKESKLSFLGGVQVPVSGPQAYAWQPQFNLTWKW